MTTPLPAASGPFTITPEVARAWLRDRNKGNRTLSLHAAQEYADTMRDGRWQLTHQGIAFDTEGLILDGQHRLLAVTLADTTVDMMVFVGMERATFTVLDVGRRRQAGHLIQSTPYGLVAAAASRYLGVVDGTFQAGRSSYVTGKGDNDALLKVFANWEKELVRWARPVNETRKTSRVMPAPHLAVLAQAARTQHAHLIEPWLDGLKTGAGLEATDARLHLRNRFIADKKSFLGITGRDQAYRLIVKAWNSHAEGKPMRLLKLTEREQIPTVVQ
ncbi:hypothetical protein Q8791_23240 [Nocardiopsis sp. CT-R113]|uniref:Uncharacterized protein n=1 Tax=Nocardiopsis codii TaxID=3065942 RepID=A0ABU7KEW5_9ACTN|nr:hypothetical protein [Nocardiopsis sp. CT-R113]MEE2040137.1 hypothetical protein [Nocardiopsis sp. CT-R113]